MITSKPKFKICRRLGAAIYEKCQTPKYTMSEAKKGFKKGKKPKQLSDFGSQLIEKQKARFMYGISEKQFSKYVKDATEAKGVNAGEVLSELLESRLDNTVYRLGIGHTRALARQIVSHGHILVNDKKVTIPSYKVKQGDKIGIREGSRSKPLFSDLPKKLKEYSAPKWLSFDIEKNMAMVLARPKSDDTLLNFNAVFEYYSR